MTIIGLRVTAATMTCALSGISAVAATIQAFDLPRPARAQNTDVEAAEEAFAFLNDKQVAGPASSAP